MQSKMLAHSFVVIVLLSWNVIARSAYPDGCYQCEEEVWEEVPCDQVPDNVTTISPPYSSTSYPSTISTTTQSPTQSTTTGIPITTTTSRTTTTTATSTTTTPRYTTTETDPYQKCYCECKNGCKEFCRKVVVNPEGGKQIVQVSKISEPVAQGRVESTHYHQRELITKPNSQKSPVYTIPGSNNQAGSYKQNPSKPINYKPQQVNNNVEIPTIYVSHPSSVGNINPSRSSYNSPNKYAYVQTNNIKSGITYEEKPNNNNYYPVQTNNIKPGITYEGKPNNNNNYYPVPAASPKYVLASSYPNAAGPATKSNSIPNSYVDLNAPCQSLGTYSSPTPVQSSQIQTRVDQIAPVANDDSINWFIKQFLNGNDFGNYPTNSGPQYSSPYR